MMFVVKAPRAAEGTSSMSISLQPPLFHDSELSPFQNVKNDVTVPNLSAPFILVTNFPYLYVSQVATSPERHYLPPHSASSSRACDPNTSAVAIFNCVFIIYYTEFQELRAFISEIKIDVLSKGIDVDLKRYTVI